MARGAGHRGFLDGQASPSPSDADIGFMRRALELARLGEGLTAPNPQVGCVIVKNGAIVGEGWHKGAGQPHAEPEALRVAGDKARGATAYVTLEPCNHQGRTPPCTDALLRAGVRELVYAQADPHPTAAGGALQLQRSGVKVRGGVCAEESRSLVRGWLHSLDAKRPYVIAKAALSLDGRIATRSGESQWITGEATRARAHELRRAADAIIVGAGTVVADDPALTARTDGETRRPLRVVLDSTARVSPGAAAFDRAGKGAMLATTAAAPSHRLAKFAEHGVETLALPADARGRPHLRDLLSALRDKGVVTVLIEGGGKVLGSFFDADLIDEIWLFLAPMIIGGGAPVFAGEGVARLADARRFEFAAPEIIDADILMRGLRRRA
jgi:diaminohydroxyphosphoribosylaminopyrimidine deaminase/5-amino-6-(5-phosphoribosylamino)uracil reductase